MRNSDQSAGRAVLEQFVVGNSDLERLEGLLSSFNIFEALNIVWQELRHSDFLAYLLSPQQSHGLEDIFLKRFLQCALRSKGTDVSLPITAIDVDSWDLSQTEVLREWQQIDVFLRNEAHELAVVIENKTGTTEHEDQLRRYLAAAERECPHWKVVAVYLTPEGDLPSDERYLPISYVEVCAVIESLIDGSHGRIAPDVRTLMAHYMEMVRRHFVADSEIAKLCKQIYGKHRQALDLIYEHRPDTQQTIRELLESWIKSNRDLALDDSSKSFIRFLPKVLDVAALRGGSGWTSTGRLVLFEFVNHPDSLKFKLMLGPGPSEARGKVFERVLKNSPPFKPSYRKLMANWNTLFIRQVLSAKAYEGSEAELRTQLEEQWKHIVEQDLPKFTKSLEGLG